METRVKAPLAANRRRALLFVLTLVLPALILLLRPSALPYSSPSSSPPWCSPSCGG